MSQSYVQVDIDKITGETDVALFCIIDGYQRSIPKLDIEGGQRYKVGDEDVTLRVTRSIARQKGLEFVQ